MKKKLLTIMIVATMFTAAIATNIYMSQNNAEVTMSDILKDNIEALATINPDCPDGCVEGTSSCYCHGSHDHSKPGLPPMRSEIQH